MSDDNAIHVLIVEDEPAYADALSEVLRSSEAPRFEAVVCGSMACAVDDVRSRSVDLVILDLVLPDASGMEAVQTLREAAGAVPMIVISGHIDEPLRLEALRAGVHEAIDKSQLTPKRLLLALVTTLEHERLRLVDGVKEEVDRLAVKLQALRDEWGELL